MPRTLLITLFLFSLSLFAVCGQPKEKTVSSTPNDTIQTAKEESETNQKELSDFMIENCDGQKILIKYLGSAENVTIPEGVTEIGERAFKDCRSLTSVVIPKGVTKIKDWAFEGCSSLTSVVIPRSMTEIGMGAFHDCISLSSLKIPTTMTEIGRIAFEGCSSLTSIVLPAPRKIGRFAFAHCTSLTSVVIPVKSLEILTEIEGCTFLGCAAPGKALLSADGKLLLDVNKDISGEFIIPDSVEIIGDHTFINCKSLTSVVIPKSVKKIEDGAFYCCTSLKSVVIPEGVTEIGSGAFRGCSSLKSIEIPESVTMIGKNAFRDRNFSLRNSMGIDDIYKDCPILTIHAPKGSKAEEYAKEYRIYFEAKKEYRIPF